MDINAFKDEFINYFEEQIINGNCETVVESVDHDLKITNRGHGIAFKLIGANFGPIFYIEELIPSLKSETIEEIAKRINTQMFQILENNRNINRAYNLEPDENVIFTARPIADMPENYGYDGVEYVKRTDLGLYVFIKTKVPNSPISMAYGHVRKLNDEEKDEVIERAKINTLHNAVIACGTPEMKDPTIPPMILLFDQNNFADYFYLLMPDIIKLIAETHNFKKIYLFPLTAYSAQLICIQKDMPDEIVKIFNETIINKMTFDYYKTDFSVPAFEYTPENNTLIPMLRFQIDPNETDERKKGTN